jgi:hypothetical protein
MSEPARLPRRLVWVASFEMGKHKECGRAAHYQPMDGARVTAEPRR